MVNITAILEMVVLAQILLAIIQVMRIFHLEKQDVSMDRQRLEFVHCVHLFHWISVRSVW